MFDHTASVWMHAKKLCTAIKEHLFSGWKGPFTHVCPGKKNFHKSLIPEIWQLTNSLQSIWGKGKVGQETQISQMSAIFSHQNSNQKNALEPAMEPGFYPTRCKLAVLRKLHNTMQDHVQPGGAQQIGTRWISVNFSVQRNFTGQIIASVMTWVCPTQIVRSRKGRRSKHVLASSVLRLHIGCAGLSSGVRWPEKSRT